MFPVYVGEPGDSILEGGLGGMDEQELARQDISKDGKRTCRIRERSFQSLSYLEENSLERKPTLLET